MALSKITFISLFALVAYAAANDSLSTLIRSASGGEELYHDLAALNHPMRFFGKNDISPVVRAKERPADCTAPWFQTKVISMDAEMKVTSFYDKTWMTVDKEGKLFSEALFWNETQKVKAWTDAISYFGHQFGIHFTMDSMEKKKDGSYRTPQGYKFIPYMMNTTFVKTSDSTKLVSCPNTTAVLGGFMLRATDPVVSGAMTNNKEVHMLGKQTFMWSYFVWAVGSRFSTKMEIKHTRPFTCGPYNACQFSGDTSLVDTFHESAKGKVDGQMFYEDNGVQPKFIFRSNVAWAGRQA